MNYSSFFITVLFSLPLCASAIVKKERTQEEIDEIIHRMEPHPGGSITHFTIQHIGENQGLYLFGETHSYNSRCQKGNLFNMRRFCKILRDADNDPQNIDRFHVLLENALYPSDYFFYDFLKKGHIFPTIQKYSEEDEELGLITVPGKICYGLLPLHEKKPFKKAIIEPFEVRFKSYGTLFIINLFLNEAEGQKLRTNDGLHEWFRIEFNSELLNVSFQDVLNEYDSLYQEIEEYIQYWEDPAIKASFNIALQTSKESFDKVRPYIEESHNDTSDADRIALTEPVLDYAERVIVRNKDLLEVFFKKIKWAFSYVYDALLFHRILRIREEGTATKIIYIGGATHSSNTAGHFFATEQREKITQLSPPNSFTQDHFDLIRQPIELLEYQNSPLLWKLYLSICTLLTQAPKD